MKANIWPKKKKDESKQKQDERKLSIKEKRSYVWVRRAHPNNTNQNLMNE